MSNTDDSKTIDFENVIPFRYRNILSDKLPSKYEVVQGPKSIFYQALKSVNQNQFGSNFIINPSMSQYVSDLMTEEVQYEITLELSTDATVGINGVIPFPATSLSFSQFPNIVTTNTLTTIIGNTNLVINSSKIMAAMFAYNNKEENNGFEFVDASMLDTWTDMADNYVDATANPIVSSAFKSACLRDPSVNYSSQTYGINGRFDVGWTTVAGGTYPYDNTPIAASQASVKRVFNITARSPIWNGLNSLTSDTEGCYVGVTNIQIQKTAVANDAFRLVNYRPPAGVTLKSISVKCAQTPILYYKLYNMPDSIPIPRFSQYLGIDYSGLQFQPMGTAAPLATFQVTSSPVNLTNIPRAIYVWCADDMNSQNLPANITSPFAIENSNAPGYQITSISSIQFAGQNIVQNLNFAYQVYSELMASEGFKKTFTETGTCIDNLIKTNTPVETGLFGSVIRIDCSKLGIDWQKYSNGVAVTLPFSVNMNVRNLSNKRTRNPYVWIQPVYDRLYTVSEGNVDSTFAILTPSQVEEVRSKGSLGIAHPAKLIGGRIHGRGLMIGGNFFGDLWNGLKNGATAVYDNVLKPVGKFAYDHRDDIISGAKALAPLVGLGKRRKGRGIASSSDDEDYHAGKLLSKNEIKRKLKFI